MSTPLPTKTPNKRVRDPKARSAMNTTLSIIGLVLGTVIVVDLASQDFDISRITEPLFVGYAYVASAFGLVVTRPNYPSF